MQTSWKEVLLSRSVWTALLAVITTLVLRYTQVPEEVWQSVLVLFTAIFAKVTIDDVGVTVGQSIARSMQNNPKKK